MDDFIYNQNDIPREQWRYGLRSSAATGCGWVATYNALRLMHYHVDIEKLIRYYEWQLPLIHGNFGTSFWGPALCFRHWGFPVELCIRRRDFDGVLDRSKVCILFYRWRRGLKMGAHFIALEKSAQGIRSWNTYRNSSGPDLLGSRLDAFLDRQKYFGCVLLGIRDKP